MNIVDQFIIGSIQRFPHIYPHRTAVLHHVLCVLGNGYYWGENGTVLYDGDDPPVWNYEDELKDSPFEEYREIDEVLFNHLEERRIQRLKNMKKQVNNAHELALVKRGLHDDELDYGIEDREIYPQSEYALLMNIPDNVHPDWLEACEEMKAVAIENGWKF